VATKATSNCWELAGHRETGTGITGTKALHLQREGRGLCHRRQADDRRRSGGLRRARGAHGSCQVFYEAAICLVPLLAVPCPEHCRGMDRA
jgi:hypothetical protein